jgi:hypothetical protein
MRIALATVGTAGDVLLFATAGERAHTLVAKIAAADGTGASVRLLERAAAGGT